MRPYPGLNPLGVVPDDDPPSVVIGHSYFYSNGARDNPVVRAADCTQVDSRTASLQPLNQNL